MCMRRGEATKRNYKPIIPLHLDIVDPAAEATKRNYKVFYSNGSRFELLNVSGYIVSDVMPTALNISTSYGWNMIEDLKAGEELRVYVPREPIQVTFYVEDYGQGYTHIKVMTPGGLLVARKELQGGQASVNLAPYESYSVSVYTFNSF